MTTKYNVTQLFSGTVPIVSTSFTIGLSSSLIELRLCNTSTQLFQRAFLGHTY